jgi:SAM-dependent methyltransferase
MSGRVRGTNEYFALSYAYDEATGIQSFSTLRPLLEDILEEYSGAARTHLDLACGTGLAMRFFTERGYVSIGIDASPSMLHVARRRQTKISVGDLRRIPLRGSFACITCLNDSVRVLLRLSDVIRSFRNVRSLMNSDSLFLFDLRDPQMVARSLRNGRFASHGEKHDMIIRTTYSSARRLETLRFSGRVRYAGRVYEIDEVLRHRTYSREEMTKVVRAAGLVVRDVITFDRFPGIRGDSAWLFVTGI